MDSGTETGISLSTSVTCQLSLHWCSIFIYWSYGTGTLCSTKIKWHEIS